MACKAYLLLHLQYQLHDVPDLSHDNVAHVAWL